MYSYRMQRAEYVSAIESEVKAAKARKKAKRSTPVGKRKPKTGLRPYRRAYGDYYAWMSGLIGGLE